MILQRPKRRDTCCTSNAYLNGNYLFMKKKISFVIRIYQTSFIRVDTYRFVYVKTCICYCM